MALRRKESLRGLLEIDFFIRSCTGIEFFRCDHRNGAGSRSYCHQAARAYNPQRNNFATLRQNVSFTDTIPFIREYQKQAIPADVSSGTASSKQLADRDILKHLLSYVWPNDNPEFRWRVSGALALLFGSKLLNIQVCTLPNLKAACACDLP
jgi:hypothetical protein